MEDFNMECMNCGIQFDVNFASEDETDEIEVAFCPFCGDESNFEKKELSF